MQDDYCRTFRGGYCEKMQAYVPKSFCEHGCLRPWMQMPSLGARAISFGVALIKHTRSGLKHRMKKQIRRNQQICRKCKWYRKQKGTEVCMHCGCRLGLKIKWASTECPLHRWPVAIGIDSPLPQGTFNADADDERKE